VSLTRTATSSLVNTTHMLEYRGRLQLVMLKRSSCCRETFSLRNGGMRLLILQCDSGDLFGDLIACARYNVTNEYNQLLVSKTKDGGSSVSQPTLVHVVFIIQLPRVTGGCFTGFQVRSFSFNVHKAQNSLHCHQKISLALGRVL
jgi:hypothetical protein